MSDSISRQAAIDVAKDVHNSVLCCEVSPSKSLLEVVKRLESLPTAEPKTKWIPISEGLPEEHEWIGTKQFGTTISDKVHITFDVNGKRFVKTLSLQNGELSDYEKRSMDVFYKGWKMLAWMPLPKPYREDGEDEPI